MTKEHASRRHQVISFLQGVSNYFDGMRKPNGPIICPKHRVEHTGKNVYSVTIDHQLHKLTKNPIYVQRAQTRVDRTLERFAEDPEYGYWIFHPGRFGRYNQSNSVIDGGACTDALSSHLLHLKAEGHKANKASKVEEAIRKHADGYLVKACVDKPITNQRLWGATGLASAYRLLREPRWRSAVLDSVSRSLEEQNRDGGFRYHPNYAQPGIHAGINDLTPYYHSRHLAFIIHCLEHVDESIEKYRDPLIKGAQALLAMYHPDGTKEMRLESKRWYWESGYEVASNSFDIYVLVKIHQLTGDSALLDYADRSFDQLQRHQLQDGGITSHLGQGHNFQCRIVWNGHVAWLARASEQLLAPYPARPGVLTPELRVFPDSGLIKVETNEVAAIVRGVKSPMNIEWGPSVGGGSLVYFGRRTREWKNDLHVTEWRANTPLNFVVELPTMRGLWARNCSFWQANRPRRDMLPILFRAWTALRSGEVFHALAYPWRHIVWKYLAEMRHVYATHWYTGPNMELGENAFCFETIPARRDGTALAKTFVKRKYWLRDGQLHVHDRLETDARVKRIRYHTPLSADMASANTNGSLSSKSGCLTFRPPDGGRFWIDLRYCL